MTTWDDVIRRLEAWRDSGVAVEDDMTPPSTGTLICAILDARQMRDVKHSVPLRTCVDGDGGVSFEWRLLRILTLNESGTSERTYFQDGQQDKTSGK